MKTHPSGSRRRRGYERGQSAEASPSRRSRSVDATRARRYGLDLVLVRETLWPGPEIPLADLTGRLDQHPAMAVEDATLLIDYEIWDSGGSLCEARAAAARTLRRLATQPVSPCSCFMKDRDCGGCSCFRDLANLPVPSCPALPVAERVETVPLAVEGLRWRARIDLPPEHRKRVNASWFLTRVELNADPSGAMITNV